MHNMYENILKVVIVTQTYSFCTSLQLLNFICSLLLSGNVISFFQITDARLQHNVSMTSIGRVLSGSLLLLLLFQMAVKYTQK